MLEPLRAVVLVTLLVVTSSSCIELGKSCTAIGCVDQATLTLRPASSAWTAGQYELRVTVARTERRCTFAVPADLPEPRATSSLCEPDLPLVIQPEVTCAELRDRDSVSFACTPIPDRYSASLTLESTPAEVSVAVVRDGETLLDEVLTLSYQTTRPNGPGCEPVCRQAHAEAEF